MGGRFTIRLGIGYTDAGRHKNAGTDTGGLCQSTECGLGIYGNIIAGTQSGARPGIGFHGG